MTKASTTQVFPNKGRVMVYFTRVLMSTKACKLKIRYIFDKVFKNGLSKICRRQPLKNLKWYGLLKGFQERQHK